MAMVEMVRFAEPLLVRLRFCGGLVEPSAWLANVRLAGVKLISGTTYTTQTYWVTSFYYDTTGQVIRVIDPVSNSTTFAYADNFFNDNGSDPPSAHAALPKPTNAYVTSVTDKIGTTSMGYYFGSGKPALATDYNSATTYSHYLDPFDRLTQTDYPIGWSLNTYTSPTEFDSYAPIGTASASVACASCTHTQTLRDSLGRVASQSLVNNPSGQSFVTASYDSMNRTSSVSHPNFGSQDPNDVSETASYDGLGRSKGVVHPDGQSTQIAYGTAVVAAGGLSTQQGSTTLYGLGFPVVSTDEAGKKRQQWMDGFGRVIEVDEPNPTLQTPLATFYTYDVLGNLTGVTQGSQTRSYQYDGLSRLTQQSTPEASTTTNGVTVQNPVTLSYVTAAGGWCSGNAANPCTTTDARGYVTTYSYDTANRLIGETHVPTTTGPVTYKYGTSAGAHNIDRLVKMTDPSGSEAYAYDTMGHVTALTKTIGSTKYVTKYAYNKGGQLTHITYPSGRVVYNVYDDVGHLCLVSAVSSTKCSSTSPYLTIASASYDAANRPLSATYGNGVAAAATYSPQRSELTSLSYVMGSSTLFGLNYYYQQDSTNCPGASPNANNGQIQCIKDSVQASRSAAYTYDALGRLSTANTAGPSPYARWGLSETYDRYGNRSAQNVTAGIAPAPSFSINPANNQINTSGYTYDPAGHLAAEPWPFSGTYSYDGEECLTNFSGNGNTATYTCDGNHLRVQKAVNAVNTTVSIYSGGQVIAEYDNGAAVISPTREYIYGHNLLATVTGSTKGAGGTIVYQHRDHRSPRLYTNSSGADSGEQGTFPFGEPWYNNNATSNWVFTTYERDQESGIDYALARSYYSSEGRFMSPDPVGGKPGNPQSWNRYAYSMVNDNRIND